ncbi:MAG: hypothetical protein KAI79_02845 [Bacteroidales bacterium]|nr:hypothetical protein [Bacteroidales bacterium]
MKNYKIQITELGKDDFEIVCSGKLVLDNIEAIKKDILKNLNPDINYSFEFQKINQIDLPFIQLLLVIENDKSYKNVSIDYETIHEFKDFQKYISHNKI